MLDILIADGDRVLAELLKDIIHSRDDGRVTAIATSLKEVLESISSHAPNIALIDINLSGGTNGIEVAVRLRERGIPCLFSAGSPMPFSVPGLALGCLCKPYSNYSVSQTLTIVEQLLGGKQPDADIPLELYQNPEIGCAAL